MFNTNNNTNNNDSRNRGRTPNSGRPPPFNPYYDAGPGRNKKNHRPPFRNNPPPNRNPNLNPHLNLNLNLNPKLKQFLKRRVLPFTILTAVLAAWFLTPISNVVTSLVLQSVPVSSDVQLGIESWRAMQQKDPYKYQQATHEYGYGYGYDGDRNRNRDRWGVESIGHGLVQSVLYDERNRHRLCDAIVRTSSSSFHASSRSHLHSKSHSKSHSHSHSQHGSIRSFLQSAFDVLIQTINGHSTTAALQRCNQQALQYNWSFQVIQSRDGEININAFALPGGIIRVTDSLLNTLHLSRGEIAALLAHEMSHVLHRHGQVRLLQKNLLQTILRAVVYDDNDNNDNDDNDNDNDNEESFGEAVSKLMVEGASFLGEMKFSRRNEYEADSGAWDLLLYGGVYNPRSVQHLLEKLHSLENGNKSSSTSSSSSSSSSYMSGWHKTHPGTGERIEVLKEKWNELSWKDQRRLQTLLS